jgi:hypothetical protein
MYLSNNIICLYYGIIFILYYLKFKSLEEDIIVYIFILILC